MTEAYQCPLCGGSAWARADLARRTEAAMRAILLADDRVVAQVAPGYRPIPEEAIRELRACLDLIDGKAPEQLALTIGE